METLAICRICLNSNIQYVVKNQHLQDTFERLTRIPSDMRPLAVCYICYAQLRASHRFKLKCLRAEQLLAQMLDQRPAGDEILDPILVDLSAHKLSITSVVKISIDNTEQDLDFDRMVEQIIHDDDVKSVAESEQELPDPVDTIFKEYLDIELEEDVKTVKKKLGRSKDLEIAKQKLIAEVASDLETDEKMEEVKLPKKRKGTEDDHKRPPTLKKQFIEVQMLQDKQHDKSAASEFPEIVMEPRLRAIPEQFSILIDFMERHGDLSKPGPGPRGRIKCDRLWTELTNMLNSLGGGVKKSSDKWRKVWADWKTKSKKKYIRSKLQATRSGGPGNRIYLNPLEKRVVAVIGSSVVVDRTGFPEPDYHVESAKELPLEHAQYALDNVDCVLEDHDSQNTTPQLINDQAEASSSAPINDKQFNGDLPTLSCSVVQTFEDKVVSMLTLIKTQNCQILNVLNQKSYEGTLKSEFSFPMKTLEDLEATEELLKDKENYSNLTSYMKTIGGRDAVSKVSRIMKIMFCNSLATQYNFYGKRSQQSHKKPFCKLRLRDCVVKAVKETAGTTEKDIEDCLKTWLKHAPERLRKEKEK